MGERTKPSTGRTRRPSTINHVSAALLVESLMEGPSTVYEIASDTGLSYTTVRRYVRALYLRRLCHVAGWDADTFGRLTLRAYKLGRAKDAIKPPAPSRAERARSQRQRTKVLAKAMGVGAAA